jgi:hypothetical protein
MHWNYFVSQRVRIYSKYAQILCHCKANTYTSLIIHKQAEWLLQIIEQHIHDGTTCAHPLCHIVRRESDWEVVQDVSSSHGVGGNSLKLLFFFHITWEDFGPAFINKLQETLNNKEGASGDLHFNWMEQYNIALLISYAATLMAIQEPANFWPYPLMVLFVGDNMTANKDIKKGS